MPRLLEANTDNITLTAEAIRRGDVVAFPTETVYGLGADGTNPDAVAKIFQLKQRPADNPLIVHAPMTEFFQSHNIIKPSAWDARCEILAERFWPGPLTLVLSKHPALPAVTTADRPTVAIRVPSHPVARDLIERADCPIAAPSANLSSHVSPTSAAHVMHDFAEHDDLLILNGSQCQLGLESTVVDLSKPNIATILRPGTVTADAFREVLDCEIQQYQATSQTSSPGSRSLHYAPRTPAMLVAREIMTETVSRMPSNAIVLARHDLTLQASANYDCRRIVVHIMPDDAASYAAELYAALRSADEQQCDVIVIEEPPRNSSLWLAIHDRLGRAVARRE